MATWYLDITAMPPGEMGKDANGRIVYGFNLRALKRPSTTFGQELQALLVAAGVGSAGTTIFRGPNANLPTDESVTFLVIRETGGLSEVRTHDAVATAAYERPSAQLKIHGWNLAAVRTMAWAAYGALRGVRNQNVTAA